MRYQTSSEPLAYTLLGDKANIQTIMLNLHLNTLIRHTCFLIWLNVAYFHNAYCVCRSFLKTHACPRVSYSVYSIVERHLGFMDGHLGSFRVRAGKDKEGHHAKCTPFCVEQAWNSVHGLYQFPSRQRSVLVTPHPHLHSVVLDIFILCSAERVE